MGEIVHLATRRSIPKDAEIPFSPVEMLRQFLADVEAGKERPICLSIHYFEALPNGDSRPCWIQVGMTRAEQIALLEIVKGSLIDDWRG